MGLREDLLPAIQGIRNIAVDLGVRRYQVWLRLVTTTGSRVGAGTRADETTVDTYLGKVKLKQPSSKDIVAGTEMSEGLFELGPFTPEHNGSLGWTDTKALSPADLSPGQTGTPTSIYYLIKGPGLPTDGILCSRVKDDLSKPFHYTVWVKNTGRKATP